MHLENLSSKNIKTLRRIPMSFQLNNAQQMAIHDSLYNLTEREMKHLKSSWP